LLELYQRGANRTNELSLKGISTIFSLGNYQV